MGVTRKHHVGESTNGDAGALLEELLTSLLNDFEHWFQRGEQLLQECPDAVMSPDERQILAIRLRDATKTIAATRSLMAASSEPMAISMDAMQPWHALVTEVWALAAGLRSFRSPQAPS